MQIDLDSVLVVIANDFYFPQKLSIGSELTRYQYSIAFKDFQRFLKREPVAADLNDLSVAKFRYWLFAKRKLSHKTANERSGRIIAMWTWLAKKRIIDAFPTVERIREPRKLVRAFTLKEMAAIFHACKSCKGRIGGTPAKLWWRCYLGFMWCTGERPGASIEIKWADLDWETGFIFVPYELRKGQSSDETYPLWPELLDMFSLMNKTSKRIFERKFSYSALCKRYKCILRRAGIDIIRYASFKKWRISHGSYVDAMGKDATDALRHRDPKTTKQFYIDRTIKQREAVDLPRDFLRA